MSKISEGSGISQQRGKYLSDVLITSVSNLSYSNVFRWIYLTFTERRCQQRVGWKVRGGVTQRFNKQIQILCKLSGRSGRHYIALLNTTLPWNIQIPKELTWVGTDRGLENFKNNLIAYWHSDKCVYFLKKIRLVACFKMYVLFQFFYPGPLYDLYFFQLACLGASPWWPLHCPLCCSLVST